MDVINIFMSNKRYHIDKFTSGGKPIYYSYLHIRKYHDPIRFIFLCTNVSIPEIYELEMIGSLVSTKKNKIGTKQR